jgi:hypothetical protein
MKCGTTQQCSITVIPFQSLFFMSIWDLDSCMDKQSVLEKLLKVSSGNGSGGAAVLVYRHLKYY